MRKEARERERIEDGKSEVAKLQPLEKGARRKEKESESFSLLPLLSPL
jgi:hypothetical protein